MTKNNKKGFTLVELIIVIAIIGILAGVLFPTITGYLKNAKISTHEQEASAINNVLAVESIFNDVNYFQPQELETLLVGMDYELTSTVEDYAFVYDVSKNRVEYIPIGDAKAREKVGATVYEGIESVFGNHLTYIDQSDTSIRRTIDGLRSLVADARLDVEQSPVGSNDQPINNYERVLNRMDQIFKGLIPDNSTDSIHLNLRKFSPKNGGLYIDESGMYGDLTKVITGVSFTPMISTIPSPYKGLMLRFGLIIELPSSVQLVQSSAFSNIEVYGSDGLIINNPTEAQKPVIKSSETVNFTGVISSNLKQEKNKSAVTYKVFTGYTLRYELQKRIFVSGKYNSTVIEETPSIIYDTLPVGDIYSLIPRITMNNNQVDLNTLVSIDVRSKIYGDVLIFSAAGIDKEFNGYKLTNLGSIIDVKHSVSNIYGTGVMTNDDITGKRVIISDPLQGYNFVNYSNVRVSVMIQGSDTSIEQNLKKVTSSDTSLSEGVISAYLGDYIFERDGNTDLLISGIKVYATINGVEQLVFAKKLK